MKQLKITKPNPAKTGNTSTTRQEIDAYAKELTRMVEKDPKKASKVFKGWLDQSAKSAQKKRAA